MFGPRKPSSLLVPLGQKQRTNSVDQHQLARHLSDDFDEFSQGISSKPLTCLQSHEKPVITPEEARDLHRRFADLRTHYFSQRARPPLQGTRNVQEKGLYDLKKRRSMSILHTAPARKSASFVHSPSARVTPQVVPKHAEEQGRQSSQMSKPVNRVAAAQYTTAARSASQRRRRSASVLNSPKQPLLEHQSKKACQAAKQNLLPQQSGLLSISPDLANDQNTLFGNS